MTMSNETEQDVFEDALRALEEFGEQGSSWEMAYDDLSTRYADALQDNLPVIPKAVSEYIKWGKEHGESLYSMIADYPAHLSYEVEQFVMDWMPDHSDTFARAWLDGYKVEANEP